MPICFTRPLCHDSDRLHTAPPLLRSRLPHPLGINLVTYNIRDDCGFAPSQSIRAVHIGNYNLMLLTEKNIPYEAYCYNRLGYGAVCSQTVGITAKGAQWGVDLVIRKRPERWSV